MPFKSFSSSRAKKKPPPRPPPPDFSKLKSKSYCNINKFDENNGNLIDWSPPSSPKVEPNRQFGGSVSSSFSSSTSSLSSSKKSGEFDLSSLTSNSFNLSVWGAFNSNGVATMAPSSSSQNGPVLFGPTIIRPQQKKPNRRRVDAVEGSPTSLPMPKVPPPSPPKDVSDVITPYGIAVFDFPASQAGDLGLEADDVVILLKRVNKDWLHGQIGDREGIFPENFIKIIVPLPNE